MSGHSDVTALAAVLFDMDGLLIDSERLWLQAEYEVVGRLGGEWGPEHQRAVVGGPFTRAIEYMIQVTGADVSTDEVARWLLDAMVQRLRSGVEMLPGADELLDAVTAAGVPRALVSSSHRPLVDAALGSIGADRFTVTVAGDEVDRVKPAPEPYLVAARMLRADPARCVALEDSPNGVASAEAAGCVTVVVPSIVAVEPTPNRTLVGSLADLDPRRLNALVEEHAAHHGAVRG